MFLIETKSPFKLSGGDKGSLLYSFTRVHLEFITQVLSAHTARRASYILLTANINMSKTTVRAVELFQMFLDAVNLVCITQK